MRQAQARRRQLAWDIRVGDLYSHAGFDPRYQRYQPPTSFLVVESVLTEEHVLVWSLGDGPAELETPAAGFLATRCRLVAEGLDVP